MEINRLVCERLPIEITKVLNDNEYIWNHAKVTVISRDDLYKRTLIRIASELPGVLKERIIVSECWPKDWIEALKDRFLPIWARRYWPVKYNRVDIDQPIYAVCPHLSHKAPDNRAHLEFLFPHAG